jgi:hypothetical protein
MSKRVAVLVALLMLGVPVLGAAQGISGGIKGGALFATVPDFSEIGEEMDHRLGVTGGVFLTLSLLPGLAIQPEAIFTQKGATATLSDGDYSLKLDYLDIPVLARLSFGAGGVKVYGFAGPSFNIRLKAEAGFGDDMVDISEELEKSDVSFVAGIGVEISKLLIEGRWLKSVKDIAFEDDVELKPQGFAIMAGFRF